MTEGLSSCRICRNDVGEFQTIDVALQTIFNDCTHLGAVVGDDLPQTLCAECVYHLNFVSEFLQKAVESDTVFREQLVVQNEAFYEVKSEVTLGAENGIYENDKGRVEVHLETSACDAEEDVDMLDKNSNASDANYSASGNNGDLLTQESLSDSYCHSDIGEKSNADASSADDDTDNLDAYDTCQKIVEITRIEPEPAAAEATSTDNQLAVGGKQSMRRNFRCTICDKRFTTRQKLKQHDLVHTKAKDFECPICGKCFATIYRQRNHTKTHTNERNYVCEVCDKRFVERFQLKIHMATHNSLRPHKCNVCSMSFHHQSAMKTHMTLHEGKTIECDLCQLKFSRVSHLKIHLRVHTGDRPYKCTYCDCAYIQKSHLDRHLNVHKGIRFQCDQCNKQYTKKPSLDAHIEQHHCSKTFTCQFCFMDFNKQKGYYYHMKKKHPNGLKAASVTIN